MELKLIPNAKEVAFKASSMRALYVTFAIDMAIKVLEWIQTHRDVTWQDAVIPIALMLIGGFRLIQQQALTTATEQRLEAAQITTEKLAEVATTAGPPITHAEVQAIKAEAKEIAAAPSPTVKE